jgi:hypothetical protein
MSRRRVSSWEATQGYFSAKAAKLKSLKRVIL